jgi:hypothetical protein
VIVAAGCVSAASAPAAHAQKVGDLSGIFGARLGGAQRQSAYIGIERFSHVSMEDRSGYALEFELGRSAGQIGIGGASYGQISPIVRYQVVGMRTWGRATDLQPGQDYVGTEVQATLLLGASVGTYWRVKGSAPGDARYHSIRIVIGI